MIMEKLDKSIVKKLVCNMCDQIGDPIERGLYLLQFDGKTVIVCENCIIDLVEEQLRTLEVI